MRSHPLPGLVGHGDERLKVSKTEGRPIAPGTSLICARLAKVDAFNL